MDIEFPKQVHMGESFYCKCLSFIVEFSFFTLRKITIVLLQILWFIHSNHVFFFRKGTNIGTLDV